MTNTFASISKIAALSLALSWLAACTDSKQGSVEQPQVDVDIVKATIDSANIVDDLHSALVSQLQLTANEVQKQPDAIHMAFNLDEVYEEGTALVKPEFVSQAKQIAMMAEERNVGIEIQSRYEQVSNAQLAQQRATALKVLFMEGAMPPKEVSARIIAVSNIQSENNAELSATLRPL